MPLGPNPLTEAEAWAKAWACGISGIWGCSAWVLAPLPEACSAPAGTMMQHTTYVQSESG